VGARAHRVERVRRHDLLLEGRRRARRSSSSARWCTSASAVSPGTSGRTRGATPDRS
jgi:hypothetical protein